MSYDPYPVFPTLNQTQLGQYFGVTSHVVGKWLKEVGLRQPNGDPHPKVIEEGIAERADLGNGFQFWVWDKERTIKILEEQGHKLKGSESPPILETAKPVGPFEARRNSADGFELVDGNGIVSIWCRGESLAKDLENILNLCWRNKKFF